MENGAMGMHLELNLVDSQYLQRIAEGDHIAFQFFYRKYSQSVFQYAFQLLNDKGWGEEVVQEVFLKIWQGGNALIEIKQPKAYLFSMVRNHAFTIIKRQQLQKSVEQEVHQEWTGTHVELENSLIFKESMAALHRVVDTLPEYQRRVYIACYQKGLKYEEAAKELNLSKNSVQTYMKMALKSIRLELKKHQEIIILMIFIFF